MKFIILTVFIVNSFLTCALAIAECTSNRNIDVIVTKPDYLYTQNVDGTVIDYNTGLMWQKCSLGFSGNDCSIKNGNPQKFTWHDALIAANTSIVNKYTDWRLPNKNELESLVEDACHYPAINETVFPNTQKLSYWTSSPYVARFLNIGSNEKSWIINFNSGSVIPSKKTNNYHVRLVRLKGWSVIN